jgi:hypothetical protein
MRHPVSRSRKPPATFELSETIPTPDRGRRAGSIEAATPALARPARTFHQVLDRILCLSGDRDRMWLLVHSYTDHEAWKTPASVSKAPDSQGRTVA